MTTRFLTNDALIALKELDHLGEINSYMYDKKEWAHIAKGLQCLKRQGIVFSKKEIVYGGVSGALTTFVWRKAKMLNVVPRIRRRQKK